MSQIIPLTSSPNQSLSVNLQVDGAPLTLELQLNWNEMAGYWMLAISDAAGKLLVDSLPLLTGWYPAANVLAQFGYLKIGSLFILNEGTSSFEDYPLRNDLGSNFVMLWGDTAA